MIDKRLIGIVPGSMRYVGASVALQWASLVANMGMVLVICRTLSVLWAGTVGEKDLVLLAVCVVVAAVVRGLAAVGSARMGFLASREVKRTLRHRIYEKLLRLGPGYREDVRTSEETYFGAYLPQFFYAMLAPLTLFVALAFVNVPAALVLLVCAPLIPVAIAAVQTWAKRLLGRYWGQYTELGDTFLENLQGLTTLKVYQADEFKQAEMNEQAEKFRRITMRVLTMQLNSITIMDLVAYGGAAAGVAVALTQMAAGTVDLGGCLAIILLAADYFIPMRQLGSFFHVAMNGMAASERIFRLLELPEREDLPAAGAAGASGGRGELSDAVRCACPGPALLLRRRARGAGRREPGRAGRRPCGRGGRVWLRQVHARGAPAGAAARVPRLAHGGRR